MKFQNRPEFHFVFFGWNSGRFWQNRPEFHPNKSVTTQSSRHHDSTVQNKIVPLSPSSILLRVYRTMVCSTVIGLHFVLPWFHHSAIVLVECIAVPLCFSSVKNLHRFCFLTQKFPNMPAAAKSLRNFGDEKQISEEDAVSLDRHFTIGQTQTSFLFFQNKSAKSHKR